MAAPTNQVVTIRYAIAEPPASWTLTDDKVPESNPHLLTCDLLYALLRAWVARTGRDAQVGKDIAVRWDEAHKNVGIDPDVYVVEPRPPEKDDVTSLLLWRDGHHAPSLAIEVVSPGHPTKDYVAAPEKYAACGVGEVWIFDPLLAGPRTRGPVRLQLWRRALDGSFERVYAGEGPFHSPYLDAWVFAVDEGLRVRIADDREGTRWWMTAEEAERDQRLAVTAERDLLAAQRDALAAERDAAIATIAALEAEVRRRGG